MCRAARACCSPFIYTLIQLRTGCARQTRMRAQSCATCEAKFQLDLLSLHGDDFERGGPADIIELFRRPTMIFIDRVD